jgi:hypothetical protein
MIVHAISKTPPFSLSKKSLNNFVNFIASLIFKTDTHLPTNKMKSCSLMNETKVQDLVK